MRTTISTAVMASTARSRFLELFGATRCAVIAMVHVRALPGSPSRRLPLQSLVDAACEEAETYWRCGVDGVLVENMHDRPYLQAPVGPEVTACMTRVCSEVRKVAPGLPLGVQVLSGANREALAVAQAGGASFIRAEGFVFSHVADEGWMDSCAGELLRYRRSIGAEDILIFTDVKKKHGSHAVTADIDVVEMAQAAEFFLSDGVIVTGKATAHPTDTRAVQAVKEGCGLPIIIGSGVTVENVHEYLAADALIVGSHFKTSRQWTGNVDKGHVERFMEKMASLRR